MSIRQLATDKTLRDLELARVKEILRQHASCSLGEEAIDLLVPSYDAEAVTSAIAEVQEAIDYLSEQRRFSLGAVRDLAPLLERAKRSGVLDGEDFAGILRTIEGTVLVQQTLVSAEVGERLRALAHRLTAGGGALRRSLVQAIDERGNVRDDATPELRRLTTKRRTIEARIEEKLRAFIDRHPELIADPVITRRRGRLVVPIRSGAVSAMEFVVHDRSSTGQTLFAEPPGFVAENNVVSELDAGIREEIQQILRALTNEFVSSEAAFLRDRAVLAHLDSLFARAGYALRANACFPQIGPTIVLRNARHPLLNAQTAVPLNLSLGREHRMMVLTGPNTGGKTVALKTVGLLLLMTQSAIPIPASPDTQLPVLECLRTDIGDEQSIAQNLSTFSAHMTNIVSLLREATASSLVLLDELGAGTDPQEGAALGLSIMEALLESDAIVLISTHLTPLKYFAIRHPKIKTASMEFDLKSLSPTYRVIEGVPGRSNAFIIAEQLGLPRERIDRARSFLSQGEIRAEDILDELERERQAMQKHRQATEAARNEAERLRVHYDRQLSAFEQEKEEALSSRFKALDQFLRETQKRLESQLATSNQDSDPQAQRRSLQEIAALRDEVRTRQDEARAVVQRDSLAPEMIIPGTVVHIRSLDANGRVLQVSDKGKVTLDLDGVRVQADIRDLWPERRPAKPSAPQTPTSRPRATLRARAQRVPLELDVRGLTINDALRSVEAYLDDLLLADIRRAQILHGKGTGALREAIQTYLGTCRFVSSYRFAPPNLGGEGVTEFELSAAE